MYGGFVDLVFGMVVLFIITTAACQPHEEELPTIPIFSEQISQQIFHNYSIYTLFVIPDENLQPALYETFKQFCHEYKALCALVNLKSQLYHRLRSYIGAEKEYYVCIIDFARRSKYLLPLIDGMTSTDFIIFQGKFQQGVLQVFEASEQPQNQPYLPCRKIVSSNLPDFIYSDTPMKMLFLYTINPICEVCPSLLHNYEALAQKFYDPAVITFGYYDIFLNDNTLITDQILPHFLLYKTTIQDKPIGIQFHKFDSLQNIILKQLGRQPIKTEHQQEQIILKNNIDFTLDFDSETNYNLQSPQNQNPQENDHLNQQL